MHLTVFHWIAARPMWIFVLKNEIGRHVSMCSYSLFRCKVQTHAHASVCWRWWFPYVHTVIRWRHIRRSHTRARTQTEAMCPCVQTNRRSVIRSCAKQYTALPSTVWKCLSHWENFNSVGIEQHDALRTPLFLLLNIKISSNFNKYRIDHTCD